MKEITKNTKLKKIKKVQKTKSQKAQKHVQQNSLNAKRLTPTFTVYKDARK